MKNKIFPIFLSVFFFTIFFIFYKGLQTPNIYTPKTDIQKNIPIFEAEILDTVNKINDENPSSDKKSSLKDIPDNRSENDKEVQSENDIVTSNQTEVN